MSFSEGAGGAMNVAPQTMALVINTPKP